MMAPIVKVFGCRPTKMTPRTPGPASANLQRRKPREGMRQTVRRALSKMVSRVISIRSREISKNLGFEYVYNFGVMMRRETYFSELAILVPVISKSYV